MCIGCRERAEKGALLRFVAGSGAVRLDPRQTARGRGAYLHPSVTCLNQAARRRAFGRALRAEVDTLAAAAVIREVLDTLA